jgi:muramoyltetrapeptide carboxypeptidase LdcA involved in peptidoglycan recycling
MSRPELRVPPKPTAGDRVAVVSPSWAAPAHFPAVHELAMRRLRDELGLVPVEYPTTRRADASPRERAADLMTAFGDPSIRAILATIGGEDQIRVLPHLDAATVVADPKPFLGFSDNTNLLNWLWNLGIVSYHGGSTQVQLGRGGSPHPVTLGSIRAALLTGDEVEILPVTDFSEDPIGWDTPEALTSAPPTRPSTGWEWDHADRAVNGPTWGGNLEVIHWNLAVGRWMRPAEDYDGCVLFLETSEEMPSATDVYRMLRNLGERGLLARVAAGVFGRPKAAHFGAERSDDERRRYVAEQRDAVRRAFDEYAPRTMLVFGLDIGHTDPQWVVPYGGLMRVDGVSRTIHVRY